MNLFNRHTATTPTFRDLLAQAPAHYAFRAQGDGEAVIDIFDEISDWWGFGVRQMAFDLQQAQNKDLLVRIHSPGGLVTEGIGIRNLIRAHPGTTTTRAVGFAASIASVILLAGDRVEMSENSFLMIHRPWMFMVGDADEARDMAELLDKMENNLEGIYTAAILKRRPDADRAEVAAQVAEWMNAETWFTADEALEAGFIDAVTDAVDFVDDAEDAEKQLQAVAKFEHTPAQLRAQFQTKISNAMSDKKSKSLLAQLRALLIEDIEEPEADAAADDATDDAPAIDLDAAREALEAEGYTVAAPDADDDTTDDDGEEAAAEPDAETAELLASLRDEVQALRAQVKRKAGAPSGGGTGDRKTSKAKTEREKAFDAFVPAVLNYARKNS